MTFIVQSRNLTTTLTTRRPTLLRVWRADGPRLTSSWIPTLTPKTPVEGGPRA